jgi:hypothetical protein
MGRVAFPSDMDKLNSIMDRVDADVDKESDLSSDSDDEEEVNECSDDDEEEEDEGSETEDDEYSDDDSFVTSDEEDGSVVDSPVVLTRCDAGIPELNNDMESSNNADLA